MAEAARSPSRLSEDTEYDPLDFARLSPVNEPAKKLFAAVTKRFALDHEWQSFSRDFIRFLPSDDEPGYYRLSLDIPPADLNKGWYAGSGRPGNDRAVELLLTPTYMAGSIQPRHFRLFHARDNGRLMLQARHSNITINGFRYLHSGDAVVADREMGIAIFGFMYKLEFTAVSHSISYTLQVKNDIVRPPVEMADSITPTPAQASLGPWRYYPAFEGGSTSTVYRGYHNETGEEVVIKRVKQQHKVDRDLSALEIDILNKIKHHAHICTLKDTFDSDGADVRVKETILVLSPPAHRTLDQFPEANCGPSQPNLLIAEDILGLWRDIFDALTSLHERRPYPIIHRDVKPQNIGVRWNGRWSGLLLDFGHAIEALASRDHRKGTVRYLSPEAMALKRWEEKRDSDSRPPHFGTPVDVYGAAIAFSEVFWGRLISQKPWPGELQSAFARHFKPPSCERPDEHWQFFSKQLQQASSWDQERRHKAKDLLHHIEEFQNAHELKRKF